jgi:hypothetical protein
VLDDRLKTWFSEQEPGWSEIVVAEGCFSFSPPGALCDVQKGSCSRIMTE